MFEGISVADTILTYYLRVKWPVEWWEGVKKSLNCPDITFLIVVLLPPEQGSLQLFTYPGQNKFHILKIKTLNNRQSF